jgi:hypothetical protein
VLSRVVNQSPLPKFQEITVYRGAFKTPLKGQVMKKIYLIGAIGALAAVTAGAPAFAGTATGSMLVQATVLESCTVVATPMLVRPMSIPPQH